MTTVQVASYFVVGGRYVALPLDFFVDVGCSLTLVNFEDLGLVESVRLRHVVMCQAELGLASNAKRNEVLHRNTYNSVCQQKRATYVSSGNYHYKVSFGRGL